MYAIPFVGVRNSQRIHHRNLLDSFYLQPRHQQLGFFVEASFLRTVVNIQ